MSTEYEPKMIIGNFLSDVNKDDIDYQEDGDYPLREHLEDRYAMLYIEEGDWIGFPVDDVLDISFATATKLQKKAKEFKKITGVEAKLAACIYKY